MTSSRPILIGLAAAPFMFSNAATAFEHSSRPPVLERNIFLHATSDTSNLRLVVRNDLQSRSTFSDSYEEIRQLADAAIEALLATAGSDIQARSDALTKRIEENLSFVAAWLKK
jgi:hypothetical protein